MNVRLGTHAASIGGRPAFMAKVDDTVWSMMYVKLSTRPMPRYMPIPPLRFRDDSDAPMMVRMKDASDDAMRLWYSTSYWTT